MIRIGDFVRYKEKNEIGLVGQIITNRNSTEYRCWWHLGGTRALINESLVERLSMPQVKTEIFANDYAKASLIERRNRLIAGDDVSDLIDVRELIEITLDNEGGKNI